MYSSTYNAWAIRFFSFFFRKFAVYFLLFSSSKSVQRIRFNFRNLMRIEWIYLSWAWIFFIHTIFEKGKNRLNVCNQNTCITRVVLKFARFSTFDFLKIAIKMRRNFEFPKVKYLLFEIWKKYKFKCLTDKILDLLSVQSTNEEPNTCDVTRTEHRRMYHARRARNCMISHASISKKCNHIGPPPSWSFCRQLCTNNEFCTQTTTRIHTCQKLKMHWLF